MVALLFCRVAALSAFLASNTVSGLALPENRLEQRSDGSRNAIENSLEHRDVVINDTRGSNWELAAEYSAAASSIIIITVSQTTTITGYPPSAAPVSTIYTPPTQPFSISTRTGTRLFPSSAITTFVTPTFLFYQTNIITQTVTTLYVMDATQTSTLIGSEVDTIVSTSTSIGYNCQATNSAPATATKAVLNGISKSLHMSNYRS